MFDLLARFFCVFSIIKEGGEKDMRVCCVSAWELDTIEKWQEEKSVDLVIFGGVDKAVSYEKELQGETRFFRDMAALSSRLKSVVVCGCITDTHGHKRKSAAVAERGKLLGVSDMLHAVDTEVSSGAMLRVYDTKAGKIGVAVAEDLLFPSVMKTLAVCGSECIVCAFENVLPIHVVLARAHAYCFGVPILLCGRGYSALANEEGELQFATPIAHVTCPLQTKVRYHLIQTRKKGCF